ncbi:MAG: GDYXXLXY domain-containing protein [Planctomycetota bacterium]
MNPISRPRLGAACAWVGLQLVFLVGWAMHEQGKLAEGVGHSILVRTVPVDPRDLLCLQYILLAYEFSSGNMLDLQEPPPQGSEVWVVLGLEGEFHVPLRAELRRPVLDGKEQVALRGTVGEWQRLEFGIERYFVPEGTETPAAKDITVRLRVGNDGAPRIETVYVNGVRWP